MKRILPDKFRGRTKAESSKRNRKTHSLRHDGVSTILNDVSIEEGNLFFIFLFKKA